MKIKSVDLFNFKRFTNLMIEDIPETAKLVLLVGANGSGKSSIFNAFECFNTAQRQGWWDMRSSFAPYHVKNKDTHLELKYQYIENLTVEKNKIIPALAVKRTEYPYFGEPKFDPSPLQKRFKNKQENFDESEEISNYLNSDDFETFYKVLPMKQDCTQLSQRQNLKKSDLAQTEWFKLQMSNILTQKS